jgi:ataxia telangiectasia mutated family protein
VLTDKAYHKIFEDLFRVVITEKAALPSANKNTKAKANANGRLQACSEAVREVAQSAASKLKPKTLEAVIEHIIQTIPYSNGEYCGPIALHYLKTLCIVLEQRSNVEHLKHNIWDDIVGFSLQGLVQYLDDNEVDPSGLSRSRTGVRRSPESFLNSANSNGRNHSQDGSLSRQNAEDLLQILSCLVSVPNAPILQRSDAIADTVIRVLSSQGSAVRQLQKIAFSILNAILSATREDRGPLAEAIAREAVPVICRFWQGKSVAKDEMLSSVRDEMLILLFLTHLHMERSVLEDLDGFASTLNDLLEVMRAEYSGRSERDQLQLEDIDMSDLGSAIAEMTPFQMHDFRLRAHNIRAERNWANLQVIGILERLVKISQQRRTLGAELDDDDMDNQPRKRKRTAQTSDRLLAALKSDEENVRIAGLQILPFVLQQTQFSGPILTDLLDQLGACALDKRGNIASWALLAIARSETQTELFFSR